MILLEMDLRFIEPKDADLVFDSFRLTLVRNENVEVIGNNE